MAGILAPPSKSDGIPIGQIYGGGCWVTAPMEKHGYPSGCLACGTRGIGVSGSCNIFGIRDMPKIPFTEGVVLAYIPQTEDDRSFATSYLRDGCRDGVYEEIPSAEAWLLVGEGKMLSSAFVVWQGNGKERKGRFVVNFHQQSQHRPKGSTIMDTIPSFAVYLCKGGII